MASCQKCRREPATEITIRRNQGMLVMHRFYRVRATLCRDCGHQLNGEFTKRTLLEGWWGVISFFYNWYCLANNYLVHRKLSQLPSPVAGEYREDLAA